ncbi:peptidoglycan/xylan/chitin deacetylase (PgdA/CDA1 family) [Streptomyces griseochromogenes]|uniref:Peptidoglycan/xylan/chitin deacetylase (PgdA/CDA1 family) n=1 Tax=Streptomyces griseochromogenes TaxID=68214 RepID=A0A1B1B8P1_9ACTN|nr:polysaccharide deacetylase family protein [Streptomyces griseochromogenes]ANP55161.1 polysaccharide deacetylase [Streptomyces griseochromogenes]MBP2050404.1 peptidoglycan/xylan/chitin deacetylase (PgdA/CDA1 family) [Streptomyces griseochromogenes]
MAVDTSEPPAAAVRDREPVVRERPRRGPAAWVAMYHSVSDCAEDPFNITISAARLDRQLAWLRGRGLRGVSVRELLAARARGEERGLVGLTFDDGYADFLTSALPVLRRHRCGATVFPVVGRLGGENDWEVSGPRKRLLGVDDIRRLAAAGVEVGSHSLTHLDLSRVPDDVLHAEVHGSHALLAEITGQEIQGFCYPYGTLDARVRTAVRAAGYRYACAIAPGTGNTGDLALPRIHIGQADTAPRLEMKRRLAHFWGRTVEAS